VCVCVCVCLCVCRGYCLNNAQHLIVVGMQVQIAALLLLVATCALDAWASHDDSTEVDSTWKLNYKPWRQRDAVSVAQWAAGIPAPRSTVPQQVWASMDLSQRRAHFSSCIQHEAVALSERVPSYKSPDLHEMQMVRAAWTAWLSCHADRRGTRFTFCVCRLCRGC
jgi:hypothetical protein